MAKLIKSSGEVLEAIPANGRTFTLKELQTFVGGYIEVVQSALTNVWLVVNEDGAITSPPMPINPMASSMYREAGGDPHWPIRGDVVLGTKLEIDG